MAAFVMRLESRHFAQVEKMLLRNLLNDDFLRVMLAQDIWCVISRASDPIRTQHLGFLSSIMSRLPALKKVSVVRLVQRLLNFCSDDEVKDFLLNSTCDEQDLQYFVKYISDDQKMMLLEELYKNYVQENCLHEKIPLNKISYMTLMFVSIMKAGNQELYQQMGQRWTAILIAVFLDEKSVPKIRNVVRSSLLKLSSFIKLKGLLNIIRVKMSSAADALFYLKLVNLKMMEMSSSRKYSKLILDETMKIMKEFSNNTVVCMEGLQMVHAFCMNTQNPGLIIKFFSQCQTSLAPLDLRNLYAKFISPATQTEQDSDKMKRLVKEYFEGNMKSGPKPNGRVIQSTNGDSLVSHSPASSSSPVDMAIDTIDGDQVKGCLTSINENLEKIASFTTIADESKRQLIQVKGLLDQIVKRSN